MWGAVGTPQLPSQEEIVKFPQEEVAKSGSQMEMGLLLQPHVASSQVGHLCPAGTWGIVRT